MGTRDLVRKVVLEQRVAVWATSDAPKEPAVKKVVPNRDDRLRPDWLSGLHGHAVSRTGHGLVVHLKWQRAIAVCRGGSGMTGMTGSRLGQRPAPSSTAAGDQIEDEVIEAPSGTSWALRLLCALGAYACGGSVAGRRGSRLGRCMRR